MLNVCCGGPKAYLLDSRVRVHVILPLLMSAIVASGCSVSFKLNAKASPLSASQIIPTPSPSSSGSNSLFTTVSGLSDIGGNALNGIGPQARFFLPEGITTDGTNIYIGDTYNHIIRKIVVATNQVTTLAGAVGFSAAVSSTDGTGATARFHYPRGLAASGGKIYVTENEYVSQVDSVTGNTTFLAGDGGFGIGDSSDGTGTTAEFVTPFAAATDGTNLYVVDTFSNSIRKINLSTGNTTTLAGSTAMFAAGGYSDSTDGTGATALFNYPDGITIDPTNTYLYVSDDANFVIRKVVIATGNTTTLAGSAGVTGNTNSTDGTGATARFSGLLGMTADNTSLYVVDGVTIRKINETTGNTTTLAGLSGVSTIADSTDGTGTTARFSSPIGIVKLGNTLYVAQADTGGTVRAVSALTGNTTTIAGVSITGSSNSTDGTGATARLNDPTGIAGDGTNLYISDMYNQLIRKINIATGNTTTLAGTLKTTGSSDSSDGTGATAKFNNPGELAVVGSYVYVLDQTNNKIRKVSLTTGNTTTLAGSVNGSSDSTDGTGATAQFNSPYGIATDGTYLYVTDLFNYEIRKIAIATGNTTTLSGSTSNGFTDSTDGTGATAQFANIRGIVYANGDLYVADWDTIRRVDPTTGNTVTIAGQSGVSGSLNGNGTSATFLNPSHLASDGTQIFITDTTGQTPVGTIRALNLTTMNVSTYFGPGGTIDTPLNQMPTLQALFYSTQGLFFSNQYSSVSLLK